MDKAKVCRIIGWGFVLVWLLAFIRDFLIILRLEKPNTLIGGLSASFWRNLLSNPCYLIGAIFLWCACKKKRSVWSILLAIAILLLSALMVFVFLIFYSIGRAR